MPSPPGPRHRSIAEKLDLFVRRAVELEAHPVVTNRAHVGLTVHAGGGEMSVTVAEPDDTELSSLLLKLRPFLLQNEDAYLPTILNIARRTIDDAELAHAIESGAVGYGQAAAGAGLKVVINGRDMTPAAAAELYLYSTFYHSDRDREAELGAMAGPAASLTRYLFLDYIIEVTKVITWTRSVLDEARVRGVLRDSRLPEHLAHPHLPQPPLANDPRGRPEKIKLLDDDSRRFVQFAESRWSPPAQGNSSPSDRGQGT